MRVIDLLSWMQSGKTFDDGKKNTRKGWAEDTRRLWSSDQPSKRKDVQIFFFLDRKDVQICLGCKNKPVKLNIGLHIDKQKK